MTLALLGGEPIVKEAPKAYPAVGEKEVEAVTAVAKSGCLSGYYGSWGKEFMGGEQIQAFEAAWAKRFEVKHALAVNSASSGLLAAMGAVGVGPGDEVIVPPYTMSATAMAPLVYGGIPVFADIEEDTFCLDVDAVRELITPKTKAILVVNLFGHPARLHDLKALADEHGIYLVEDNAQGPLATENGVYAGTIGHMGVYSLNYHKHIHTGEGGIVVTNDDELAKRVAGIRNHGENVVRQAGIQDLTNMVGYNLRMTELSAAVGLAQLDDVDTHVQRRIDVAERLSDGIRDVEGISVPVVREGSAHVYYLWAIRLDQDVIGLKRETILKALDAEGVPVFAGYVEPLYLLPLFQERIAIGRDGFPFTLTDRTYDRGLCPVAERLYDEELLLIETCTLDIGADDADLYCEAIRKVLAAKDELLVWEQDNA